MADVRACCVRDQSDVAKYVFYSAASCERKCYDAWLRPLLHFKVLSRDKVRRSLIDVFSNR